MKKIKGNLFKVEKISKTGFKFYTYFLRFPTSPTESKTIGVRFVKECIPEDMEPKKPYGVKLTLSDYKDTDEIKESSHGFVGTVRKKDQSGSYHNYLNKDNKSISEIVINKKIELLPAFENIKAPAREDALTDYWDDDLPF